MQKPFVLVADDNEATCTLITAVLHKDFVVETAFDGLAAIERLKSRQYAAVLLDLVMPQVDGYAVLDFLRAERPEVLPKVIVITAAVLRGTNERAARYGVCSVISKPFEVDQLLQLVRSCAGNPDSLEGLGPLISSSVIWLLADLLR